MKRKEKDKELTAKYAFGNALFCLKYLFKLNKKMFFIRIPSTILLSAANFISIIFIRFIINEITVGKRLHMVIIYVLGMVIASFTVSFLNSWLSKLDAKEKEVTAYKINSFIADLAMKMKYSDLEAPRMKDFISLAGSTNPFFGVLDCATGFFGAFLNSVGLAAIIVTIQPIILLFMGLIVIMRIVIEKKMREYQGGWHRETAPVFRKRNYLFGMTKELRFGKEIRINSLQSFMLDKINNFHEETVWPADRRNRKAVIKFNSFTETVAVLQQLAVYLYLGYRVVFGGMLLGDFTMYMTSIDNFSDYIAGLVGNYSLLFGAGLEAREVRYCIEFSKHQDKDSKEGTLANFDKNNFVFEFKNVSFKYPNTERMILKDVNLQLKAGETLSLVGENGAGKSTFVKLLCRFYDPTEGEILLNGMNIATIPYADYLNLIAVVFQDFKLFSYSVRENIALCDDPESEKLSGSVIKSGLEKKIESLPAKMETMMFKEFDSEGIEFSGGEGQKVAIARAIYKDSPVIILDEPTSALDPIAEYDVYKRFSDMSKGRCAIYISHRMSSTRFTDKIAVFSDGYLCEYGNHKELINIEDGIYKNMFKMQAQYYQ